MQKLTNQERLRPWMGFALFGITMAIFLTVCVWMQQNWGIAGLVLTELLIAGIAIVFCLIRKVKISEVLPIKKITLRDFAGCVVLLIGTYLISILSVFITAFIFPSSASEAGELGSFLYEKGLGLIPLLLIVAVLPGICEETLHRGALLSTFRGLDKEWIAVLCVGLFFSLNHVSILRGPFTFMLGAVFAYIVIKKNNILLTMIMHSMLNSFSVIVSYFTYKNNVTVNTDISVDASSLGLYTAALFFAPLVFVAGKKLLLPETHKKKHFAIAGIVSAAMLIVGIVLMVAGSGNAVFTSNGPLNMAEGEVKSFGSVGIEEEKDYSIALVISGSDGSFRVEVTDENEELICGGNMDVSKMEIYTSTVHIEEGKVITVNLISLEGDPGENSQYSLIIK
ncbi:MAG: CPBP family intramembrane metalloprotease [Lachnospiraceae bacterium]|jgi:membrane protease YdiL (CAAX protease family)|nr:CPBP family intramembrane metalloprotease [Lachnospiraceae bacterium]